MTEVVPTGFPSDEGGNPVSTAQTEPFKTGPSAGKRWRMVFGLVCALIGVVEVILAPGYGFGSLDRPKPAIFPLVVGILMIIAGLAVVFEKETAETRAIKIPTWAQAKAPVMLFGVIVVYVVVLPTLGVFLSSGLMIIAVGLLLGQRSWWKLALAATTIVVATRLLFVTLLRVPLPEGILTGLLW